MKPAKVSKVFQSTCDQAGHLILCIIAITNVRTRNYLSQHATK